MDRKLQIIILKYLKGREVSRDQIINEVSKAESYERQTVQEAINILEFDKKIGAIKKYDYVGADTFTLTTEGYETLSPWYRKKIKNIPTLEAIIIGIIIVIIGLIIEYQFFVQK